ncbi:MAG: hypothetical protein LKF31_05730 [Muribaculaceae bacterium]|jgi:hypothetical protein|nr:hypothetical protein [Muribaculaceae bacterium]
MEQEKDKYSDDVSQMVKNDTMAGVPGKMKIVFGIFMVCIYIGMALLLLTDFFRPILPVVWIRYSLAALFMIYGLWRGYRQIKGMN